MQCPICNKPMKEYKEEPSYSTKKQIEYRRTFYRCEDDDTWGRMEIPVGQIKEFDRQRAPLVAS